MDFAVPDAPECSGAFFYFRGLAEFYKDLPNITSRLGISCIFAPMARIFMSKDVQFRNWASLIRIRRRLNCFLQFLS
jgi:hypothetical protein